MVIIRRSKENAPWSAVWNRIVEWTYGISLTTVNTIARYEPSKISRKT